MPRQGAESAALPGAGAAPAPPWGLRGEESRHPRPWLPLPIRPRAAGRASRGRWGRIDFRVVRVCLVEPQGSPEAAGGPPCPGAAA